MSRLARVCGLWYGGLMAEHRRKDADPFVDDPDWRVLRTLPTFADSAAPDFEAGEILEISPRASSVVVSFELYDGLADGALPITPTPSTATITFQLLTRFRERGVDRYTVGIADTVGVQARSIEIEMPKGGQSWVRMTTAADLGTATAVWVDADEDVDL